MKTSDLLKPQPTLKGYHAWAFQRIVEILGYSHAEGAAFIINQWIRDNAKELQEDFDVSVANYRTQKAESEAESERLAFEEFKRQRQELEMAERKEFEEFKRWRRAAEIEGSAVQ